MTLQIHISNWNIFSVITRETTITQHPNDETHHDWKVINTTSSDCKINIVFEVFKFWFIHGFCLWWERWWHLCPAVDRKPSHFSRQKCETVNSRVVVMLMVWTLLELTMTKTYSSLLTKTKTYKNRNKTMEKTLWHSHISCVTRTCPVRSWLTARLMAWHRHQRNTEVTRLMAAQ